MTPQFEAACIAAATLMAADIGAGDPQAVAVAAWEEFKRQGYPLVNLPTPAGFENDAQNFADWWEGLTDLERECVTNGDDITGVGDEDTTYTLDGTTVLVPHVNDVMLYALFEHIDL